MGHIRVYTRSGTMKGKPRKEGVVASLLIVYTVSSFEYFKLNGQLNEFSIVHACELHILFVVCLLIFVLIGVHIEVYARTNSYINVEKSNSRRQLLIFSYSVRGIVVLLFESHCSDCCAIAIHTKIGGRFEIYCCIESCCCC